MLQHKIDIMHEETKLFTYVEGQRAWVLKLLNKRIITDTCSLTFVSVGSRIRFRFYL